MHGVDQMRLNGVSVEDSTLYVWLRREDYEPPDAAAVLCAVGTMRPPVRPEDVWDRIPRSLAFSTQLTTVRGATEYFAARVLE